MVQSTATSFVNSSVPNGPMTQSTKDQISFLGNFDTFLKLLITQIRNQDPLSPMESSEFTNQLVQYASVEQAIQTNKNLETLSGLTVANQAALATNYLDQWVEAPTDAITLQDGEALFTYYLPVEASSVSLTIHTLDKKFVRSITGKDAGDLLTQGMHKVLWDGTDEGGTKMKDGAYRVTLTARDETGAIIYQRDAQGREILDANKAKVPLTPNAVGRVTAYTTDSQGGTKIAMGESAVDLAHVVGVFRKRPDEGAVKMGVPPEKPKDEAKDKDADKDAAKATDTDKDKAKAEDADKGKDKTADADKDKDKKA
ncbi:hypothetical protein IHV25_00190 [Phaeovibrio sulfidiphilus]|uniref:Basal-body rod modification protein FlgD n=1 Tax=Phaeovibrio sulfidiphilus TaxID=1220600 RepID=A0A8J7CCT0_9PROT|nr:flagellar hook capping FlgD N-terminal domain-containing protein [Phaeovibrio sulfidiphilus]MBE1236079.1 hypothetical protein [Phaeovibrio sulfidiphilus]